MAKQRRPAKTGRPNRRGRSSGPTPGRKPPRRKAAAVRPEAEARRRSRGSLSGAAAAAAAAAVRKPGFYEAVAIYERGVQALQRHDFAAAAGFFRTVLERLPRGARAARARAALPARLRARNVARSRPTPKTPAERVYAATVALNSGDHAGALDHLQRALGEDPESDHAHYIMAVALGMRGRVDEALDHLRRAIALEPGESGARPTGSRPRRAPRPRALPVGARHAARRAEPPPRPRRADAERRPRDAGSDRRYTSSVAAMSDIHVVVLAAGKGTRMKSAVPKVLHRRRRSAADRARPARRRRAPPRLDRRRRRAPGEQVKAGPGEHGRACPFAVQEPQLGTGHALLQAEPRLAGARARSCCSRATCRCCGRRRLTRARRRRTKTRGAAATVLTARRRRRRTATGGSSATDGRIAAHRRAQGRVAGRARDPRDQQRHLRVRPGAAVRGARARSAPRTRRASTTCRTS